MPAAGSSREEASVNSELYTQVDPEEVGVSSAYLANIDALQQRHLAENAYQGSVVLVARHGKVCYFNAFGKADDNVPMATDSIFRLASMSKVVAAAAVLQLFEHALAGRVVRQAAHRIAIPGLVTYWDVVFAPLFAGGEVVGVVDIVTDATDRVTAFERLEARIAALEGEIARSQRRIERAVNHRASADSLFRS